MKKVFSLLLVSAILLSLFGCTGETTDNSKSSLRVGYGRSCITPDTPTELSSTNQAVYDAVFADVYMTCIAITDDNDETVLMFTVDVSYLSTDQRMPLISAASKATGVPAKNISFTCTHNHSGLSPDVEMVQDILKSAAASSAKEAMDDRATAEVYIGSTNTQGMNFVRHYRTEDGHWEGDNYYCPTDSPKVSHEREPDTQMQMIQFRREGKKNILMVNWQAHGVYSYKKEQLCADYVGPLRENIEKELDCHFAYYLGAAGNLNPWSDLPNNNVAEKTLEGMNIYGKALAQFAIDAIDSLKKVDTSLISSASKNVTVHAKKVSDEYMLAVQKYKETYGATNDRNKAVAASGNLVHSLHACDYAAQQMKLSPTTDISIKVISIGNIAFAIAPYEMFDDNGMQIKEGSPFDMTFILAYTNGRYGYIPSKTCAEHGCYGYECGNYSEIGNGELLVDGYLELLNQLHSEK